MENNWNILSFLAGLRFAKTLQIAQAAESNIAPDKSTVTKSIILLT